MGLLENLFGTSTPQMPESPPNTTVFPQQAIAILARGILPEINTATILLNKTEKCRFVDKAYLIDKEIIRRSRGKRSGMSFRIAKGVTYHTGTSDRTPITEEKFQYIPGYFYITDHRVIFVSKEKGLDHRIDSISALTTYSNALALQFKKGTVEFLLPRPDLASKTLHMINRT